MLLFYDFEVFKHDWLVVIYDMQAKEKHVIINDADKLTDFYNAHVNYIWVGYNSNHYDQYILKGILLGMNPKIINDKIIIDGLDGWQISNEFRKVKLLQYDCMPNPPCGLKTLEGFMGNDIKETDVDFNLDRKLTESELEQTVKYCTHDVEQTIEVFLRNKSSFDSNMALVKEFDLGLNHLADTGARITATILDCVKHDYNDEFDVTFLPCLKIKKYAKVLDWYRQQFEYAKKGYYVYSTFLTIDVAGVPHTFGFGGLHGAPNTPIHEKGAIYHVDVNNYYPSLLIAHDLVTRSARNSNYAKVYNIRKALKIKQLKAKTKEEKALYKKQQLPYKNILNSLSGAMKDKFNQAYDPRNNNMMCINGQLMLLDLIEHLEVIDGFKLIQSNTDGLIVKVPNTDYAFNQLDDICYEWECRMSTAKCDICLALDSISEIYQRDVNNYLWLENDGSIGERKGAYVKELSPLDYDLPIVNKALINYMAYKTPIEQTINECNDLIEFQKIVKLSPKYDYVMHNGKKYTYKCYRVFASTSNNDGVIYKCRNGKQDKFASTPLHCYIDNDNINGKTLSDKLDKQWYINLAKDRLSQFLGVQI